MTIIRLLDGTRAYLHAIIDNYSRLILSWTLEERLGSGGTCRILREAVIQLNDCPEHTIVVADSGSENVNEAVDHLLNDEELTRVLAQVEVGRCYCNGRAPDCPETQQDDHAARAVRKLEITPERAPWGPIARTPSIGGAEIAT